MERKSAAEPRITVPEGEKIEDVLAKLELSVDEAEKVAGGINQNYCCVDVSVVSPVSTISAVPEF